MHLADVITLNEIEELKNKIGNVQSNVSSIKSIVELTADNVEVIKANSYVEGKLNCNRVHGEALFNTAGTHTWTAPEGVTRVDCLIIGSSGGGGGGGGGGCGGAVYYDDYTAGGGGGGGSSGGVGASGNLWRGFIDITPNKQYSVVVGAGGAGGVVGAGRGEFSRNAPDMFRFEIPDPGKHRTAAVHRNSARSGILVQQQDFFSCRRRAESRGFARMLTAFAVLTSIPDTSIYTTGMALILDAVENTLGSSYTYAILISVIIFAYSTVVCWYFYGSECFTFIFTVGHI